jgi:hypothetical protein
MVGNLVANVYQLIRADLRAKAHWLYESDGYKSVIKVLLTDGTAAMILYRLMQWARRWRLAPLEMLYNKLNAVCCNCIIGRGAEFGPGLVLIHSTGVVIMVKSAAAAVCTSSTRSPLGPSAARARLWATTFSLAPVPRWSVLFALAMARVSAPTPWSCTTSPPTLPLSGSRHA